MDKESKNNYNSNNYNQNEDYNCGNTHQNINGKFEFQIGAIWTVFVTVFIIIAIFFSNGINLMAIIHLGFFLYLGIYILKNGLKKMKADVATENFGEECFGRIYELSSAGSTNGNTFYRANIIAYLPQEGIVKNFQEDIGYNFYEFPEGSYVRLKYFQDDVNIKEIVNENMIPEKIRNRLIMPENKNEDIYSNPNTYNTSDANALNTGRKIVGVFLLIFGFFWTSITALVSFGIILTSSKESVFEMLFNIIFCGVFGIIGIGTIIGGLFLCFKKIKSVDDNKSIKQENYKTYESKDFNNYEKKYMDNDDYYDSDPIKKF